MNICIRQERPPDFKQVFQLIEEAFKYVEYSDHTEQFLVQRLRNSGAFIPKLSMIAEIENRIIGHILLTEIKIKSNNQEYNSLALAPISVLPKYQKMGVGKSLILKAHKTASELGYESIILLGHKEYYPRFGYKPLDTFGIALPFDAPKENCMAFEIVKGALDKINGVVEYPKEFC